jgi:NADPH:quinone reductase-like Zn-dependent oxidoreductase
MRGSAPAVKWLWLPLRIASGVIRPKRRILGGYFAGEIAAVGSAVTGFAVGDQVFGAARMRFGAYAEYMTLPAHYTIVRKPRNMSFAQAAAVPMGGLNALHFMRLAQVRRGDAVLINGAGGSIGAYAVQIAKALGAEVTAVDKASKRDITRMGAKHFIAYETQDFTSAGPRFDVIFDMVASSSFAACVAALKPGGRYVCGNPRLSVMLRSILTTRLTDKTASFKFAGETREELTALCDMIERGEIGSIVDSAYPLADAALAHARVEKEERIGAIVLTMDDTPI